MSGRILEPGQERITYMFAGDASSSEKKIATERTRQSAARIHARANGTACGSEEFDPPFPFPPRGKPGRAGSPHAGARCAPANGAGTHRCCRLPPQEGSAPLRDPPIGISRWASFRWFCEPDDRAWKRSKDGRHVGLDFYDLLIEGPWS